MTNLFRGPSYGNLLASLASYVPTKRKAYFAFHYDDVMRVNAVRNAFKIYNPRDNPFLPTFYDSSLWESRKLEGDEAVKRLIREGVQHTSVVCVLVGSLTWARRWVRYEIARSVIDGKGLLAIHVNSIRHHKRLVTDARGHNPIAFMGVGRIADGTYRLFEWNGGPDWDRYLDHTGPVDLPAYLAEPGLGYVTPLNQGTMEYDFALQDGAKNIGGWLDLAAKSAGR